MKRETGLILALDLSDGERCLRVASAVEGHIDAVKVNYPLVLSQGVEFLDELPGPLIADLKVADVPNTNRLICEEVDPHADCLIAHAFPGEDSLRTCVEAFDGEVYTVVEMSHPGAEAVFAGNRDLLADIAVDAGADGVVAPATRPRSITAVKERTGLTVLSPGVGAQGGSPGAAVEAGADFLIVGRSIYDADDPGGAAEKIASGIADRL
ncbi:MAG: Orotidine 5'-phosphate decarboxylase [Methanonatronarchaeales archaeon]|nr:Orotidine 5'-phosphate decarboxylase [Methanonatronarchaeales archaeon]